MSTKLTGTIIKQNEHSTVVQVCRTIKHPIYRKSFRVSKKHHAANPDHLGQVGDTATIVETRPMSKLIHFKVTSVIANHKTKAEL
jgi:small subunit ribosomal protein S17